MSIRRLLDLLFRAGTAAGAERAKPTEPPGRHVEMLDPHELLYSVPTLHDALPASNSTPKFANERGAALMHEDEWRQAEFVPAVCRAFVVRVLQDIESHCAVFSQGLGFRDVFVRPPLPCDLEVVGIGVSSLEAVVHARAVPLYLQELVPARVVNGFALPIDDVGFLYGTTGQAHVNALGLALVGSGLGEVARLAELSQRFELPFVDWIRRVIVDPGDVDGLREWLDATVRPDPDAAI